MRIIAVDLGDARTGLAVSDATGTIAGKAWTIETYTMESALEKIAQAVGETGAERIVLGYPKNMDGTLGARAAKSEELAALLRERTGLDVVLWDERRTTVDAHRILSDAGRHGKKRRAVIDAVAATLILEGFLGSPANR